MQVNGQQAPNVSLSVADNSVDAGDRTVLTWSSTNADSCTASGGWNGARGLSGNEQTQSLQNTTNFSLNCSGPGGNASSSVTVQVNAPPPANQNAGGGGGGSALQPGALLLLLGSLSAGLSRKSVTAVA